MDRMDDQISFLCYSNQMANEQMLFPYQNTDASSLRILGDRRPFEEGLKQGRGKKAQVSHVICQPSTYNVGNLAKEAESTHYTWRTHV
ncbi:hypothetical protein PIB30_097581 [Stylosanthes scabra]|uniref:Uncharacterized protein n=1 Tax=Stylosanthes scabra TaxID=79078 RepID=A0ABU6WZC4_9FABA|nr:hypothetical protein [Stylosanthes scabra]